MACDSCRAKKVKCDLNSARSACSYCRVHHIQCLTSRIGSRIHGKPPRKKSSTWFRNTTTLLSPLDMDSRTPLPNRTHDQHEHLSHFRLQSSSEFDKNEVHHGEMESWSGFFPSWELNEPSIVFSPRGIFPGPELVRLYMQQYFDVTHSYFPILVRTSFEQEIQIISHGRQTENKPFFALYNAVFALGCELSTREGSMSTLDEGCFTPMTFFKNCLSVLEEINNPSSGITGVQALTVMVICTHFIRVPDQELESRLCTSAVQLAHILGMHCPESQVGEANLQLQHRVFWTLYSLEKHLSLRTGKLSTITDQIITCPLPPYAPLKFREEELSRRSQTRSDSLEDADFLICISKYGRLCSLIASQLSPSLATLDGIDPFVTSALSLADRIKEWRQYTPGKFKSVEKCLPVNFLLHACILQVCYCFAICSIYNQLFFVPSCYTRGNNDYTSTMLHQASIHLAVECLNCTKATADLLKELPSKCIPTWTKDHCLVFCLETILRIQPPNPEIILNWETLSTVKQHLSAPYPLWASTSSEKKVDVSSTDEELIRYFCNTDRASTRLSVQSFNMLLGGLENGMAGDDEEDQCLTVLEGILSN